MSERSENLDWLDLLRVAAAVAVVILHVAAEPVVFIQDRDSALWHAGNLLDSLSRWCIGVFIMVSGALLLDPTRDESIGRFFSKRVRRILWPLLFWSGAYMGLSVAMGERMTLGKVASMFWEGRTAYHMWYLFMILGLYAATPIFRLFIGHAKPTIRWTAIVLAFGLASAWDLHFSIGGRALPNVVPLMFIPYIGYYLIGYELRRLSPVRSSAAALWALFSLSAAVTVLGTHALITAQGVTRVGLYLYEYLSPNVIVMSVALFCLASKWDPCAGEGTDGGESWRRTRRIVVWIAPLTLGVYLWHPMMILAIRGMGYSAIGTGSVFGVLWIAIPAFAASLGLTWGMSKIPLLRQTVGLR